MNPGGHGGRKALSIRLGRLECGGISERLSPPCPRRYCLVSSTTQLPLALHCGILEGEMLVALYCSYTTGNACEDLVRAGIGGAAFIIELPYKLQSQ